MGDCPPTFVCLKVNQNDEREREKGRERERKRERTFFSQLPNAVAVTVKSMIN
jgi:hypothetical protein